MSDNKKTLNRGLDALLGSGGKPKRTIQDVNLTQINAGRFQPREVFDEESLKELTDSSFFDKPLKMSIVDEVEIFFKAFSL